MSQFEELSPAQAGEFVRSGPAFKGDFTDWLLNEIATGEARTFIAREAPVKMHRKIGPLKFKTRLNFALSIREGVRLRFQDAGKTPANCKLEDLGDEAVVLVVDPAPAEGVQIEVEATGAGKIIQASVARGVAGKSIFIWVFKVIDPAEMVGWYDPGQLAQTAINVAISTIFGRNADYRATEALSIPAADDEAGELGAGEPTSAGFFDYSSGESLWIDYVADTGDGWNSSYSVAYHAAQPKLDIAGADEPLLRGKVLIFGGDEVYPTASRPVYRQRLIDPYEAALPKSDPPHPRVFAIPGNHDWYDSLVSFTRLFCQRRWFAGWRTRQSRSYFALRLPHGWWLIGTDVQLDSDIDFPQVNYFKQIAGVMGPDDRIILCTAEPHWIYDKLLKKYDSQINENNLAFLEERIFCRKIAVFLSGDLHHYRRHSTEDNRHKITAGGGGGFLHPTHGGDVSELRNHYRLMKAFPSQEESSRLTWRNLGFLYLNPLFGCATALLYTLTCWSVMANVGKYGIHDWWKAIKVVVVASTANPTAVFWILLVWGGFLLFTDTYSKWYRWIAGTLHGVAHVLSTFLIGWFATYLGVSVLGLRFARPAQLLLAAVIIAALGWIVGSIVMGIYLTISLNFFKRHANEAFSALCIPDWKNFLRLKIDEQGRLTIFPIGIRRVPRKWRASDQTSGPIFIPDDPKATGPELIDGPIVVS
ncbi:MAG TPA: hypothetical protein VN476_02670 [Pyrinomonadaceae bacterium]|nr:hypothetical protein [Pyrinomonadaceae bacterium]